MYSQQLPVEDSDDTWGLQAVGGSAALTLLESSWELLDLIPLTNILQAEKPSVSTFFFATQLLHDVYRTLRKLGIHPGGIKVSLYSRLGTFAKPQDLSAGCENRQQSQGNHLHGLHLTTTTCREANRPTAQLVRCSPAPELSEQNTESWLQSAHLSVISYNVCAGYSLSAGLL